MSRIRAGLHGVTQGILGGFSGQEFGQGFLIGAVSSMAGSMFQGGMNAVGIGSKAVRDATTITFSGIAGGVTAEITGGDFWKGAAVGVTIGALNHVLTSIDEAIFFKKQKEAYRHMFRYGSRSGKVVESFAYGTSDGVLVLPNNENTAMTSMWDTEPLKYNSKGEITHVKHLGKWHRVTGSVHTHPVDGPIGMRMPSSDDQNFYYNKMQLGTKNYVMSMQETFKYNFANPGRPIIIGTTHQVLLGNIPLF